MNRQTMIALSCLALLLGIVGCSKPPPDRSEVASFLKAAKDGDLKVMKDLLRKRSAPELLNARSDEDRTPMDYAVLADDISEAEFLLANGAAVNGRNGHGGETPLDTAAFYGKKAMAEFLVKNGADINARDDYGHTPLHSAVAGAWYDETMPVVEFLLTRGADVNARDSSGHTPMWYTGQDGIAGYQVNQEALDYLKKHGGTM